MDRIQHKQYPRGDGGVQKGEMDVQAKPGGASRASALDASAGSGGEPRPVQAKATGDALADPGALHQTASSGVAGGGGPLPHMDAIQQAFGRHDVAGVRAHTGSAAASATAAMGAEAYATGNDVAFGSGSPSLHTAAHEAAHVVQQRGGVQLKGGVGQVGDAYEQHADAVADRVVQGKSAESLLDQHAGAGATAGAVQHKALQFEIKADLRKAMAGWGSDDNAVIARLQSATAAELQQVIADAGLMHQLQSELSRANMERVLDMLQAPVGQKLRLAMAGWGHDEAYIFRTLNAASPAELAAVAADAGLISQLKGELSRANMNRLLDRVSMPLTQKMQFAMSGWGCDDRYLTDSVAHASIADVTALAGNAALMGQIAGEMSGRAFDALRGSMAHRIYLEGHNPIAAWNLLRDPHRATRATRLLSFGSVAEQRAMLDAVIATGTDVPAVMQAFESYWNIDSGAAAGQSWTVAYIRQVHAQCKTLPEGDVRNGVFSKLTLIAGSGGSMSSGGEFQVGAGAGAVGTQPYGVGTELASAAAAGATVINVKDPAVFTTGATISVGHGQPGADVRRITTVAGNTFTVDRALTSAHGVTSRVTPDDQTAIADVAWLPAVVRHEIAHSVDTALGGLVRTGFTHGLGGFDSGVTFDTWASTMGSPWSTNDGSAITQAEKDEIKAAIEAAKKGAGGNPLNAGLARTHAVNKYWTKDVPVIEAAKPCIGGGQSYWNNPEQVKHYGSKRFAINPYYHEYQYYNEQVHAQRVRNYSIFAPAEFFAEVYTVFYEQVGTVPDAQLGARVPVSSWRDWIRNNVHNRGLTPAAPSPAGSGHPAAPTPAGEGAETPHPTVALPAAGVGKAAMNSGHV
jgi:hypothetical protein